MILYLSTHLQITGDTPHYTTITGRRVKMSVNFNINSILNGLIPYMPLCMYLPIHASVNFLCQSGFSRFLGFQTEDIFTTITTAFIVIDLDPGESLSVPIRQTKLLSSEEEEEEEGNDDDNEEEKRTEEGKRKGEKGTGKKKTKTRFDQKVWEKMVDGREEREGGFIEEIPDEPHRPNEESL